jgi:hypothetical protein
MIEADAAAPEDVRRDGPDDDVTPVDGAFRVVFIVMQLQLVLLTATTARCGPFHGMLLMLGFFLIVPYVAVPFEILILAIPGFITLAILRGARRTGRRRIWARVHFGVLAVLLATMLVGLIVMLSGHGSTWCSFF